MLLYNSLSNKKEEFIPKEKNKLTMYVCGPTVYNYIHIGNARPVVFFDTLKRYFEFIGYEVTYASNITDVDDKIIKEAIKEGTDEKTVTTRYADAYFEDCKNLGSKLPDIIPYATEYIQEMQSFISLLIEQGYAYERDGDVYFRVSKIEDYGKLSNQSVSDLISGARIDISDKKENPLDFTLWKKTEEGIKWESPFGPGRPGWHTECVCMIHKVFGDSIDIHGGGNDLKFPHHENEIAQSEAIYHNPIAKYWMHVGRLNLGHEKMSKSLGNVILVKDLIKEYHPQAFRFLLLAHHYRQPINYSVELMNQFESDYLKLYRAMKTSSILLQVNHISTVSMKEEEIKQFKDMMEDDFNTPNVVTMILSIMKKMNTLQRTGDLNDLAIELNTLNAILDVFGMHIDLPVLTEEQISIYQSWTEARKNKDFEKADAYRKQLDELGLL